MLQWGLRLISAMAAVLGSVAFAQTNPSVAFFYGKPIPVAELGQFDWVVVAYRQIYKEAFRWPE